MFDATHTLSTDAEAVAQAPAPAAAAAAPAPASGEAVAARRVPLPLRHDTLLGACEAVGEDFGFNPNFLRIAFGLGLFVSPLGTVAAYLGFALLVAASRLLFPDTSASATPAPVEASHSEEALKLAA